MFSIIVLFLPLVLAKFSVYDDLHSSPKYSIIYRPIQELNRNENYTYETVYDNHNKYICEIPLSSNDSETNITTIETNSSEYFQLVTESLSKVKELPYVDQYKFWSYKYTPSIPSLTQYHINKNMVSLNYTLGELDISDLSIDDDSQSITSTLNNGTFCDLIEDDRSTELRFICSEESNKIELLSVREYSTCRYIAQINIPKLCQFEFFKKYNRINTLSCYETAIDSEIHSIDESNDSDSSNDVIELINLLEYPKLNKFSQGLFLAESDNEFVLVNTYPNVEDISDRLIRSLFNLLSVLKSNAHANPGKEIIDHVVLQNHILNIKMNVFNSFGEYLKTVYLTVSKNSLFQTDQKQAAVLMDFEEIEYEKFDKKESLYYSNLNGNEQEAVQDEINEKGAEDNNVHEKYEEETEDPEEFIEEEEFLIMNMFTGDEVEPQESMDVDDTEEKITEDENINIQHDEL